MQVCYSRSFQGILYISIYKFLAIACGDEGAYQIRDGWELATQHVTRRAVKSETSCFVKGTLK